MIACQIIPRFLGTSDRDVHSDGRQQMSCQKLNASVWCWLITLWIKSNTFKGWVSGFGADAMISHSTGICNLIINFVILLKNTLIIYKAAL